MAPSRTLPTSERTVAILLALLLTTWLVSGCPQVPPPSNGGGDDDGTNGDNGDNGDDGGEVLGLFIGAAECRICHSRLHDDWAMTNHAHALETLKNIGQDTNPECLACHTVGFGKTDGFVDEATTPHLAGVQCENCHGPGREHRTNVADESLRPPTPIAAATCGSCHNGFHHPTFDEWAASEHGRVTDAPAEDFSEGVLLNACGTCHSGDYRQLALVEGKDVPDTLLVGLTPEEMNPVVCVTCHDPHRMRGNDAISEEGHDWQLRYPEIANPVAANSVAETTNPDRFPLCGQCHHSRGRTWQDTSRGPHHSVQANMYVGEMPVPDGMSLLVPNETTVHRFVPKQCATCHMTHQAFVSEEEPAHTGHHFEIDYAGCSAVGCHPSPESAQADKEALQADVQAALDDIAARLGDPSTWEYSATGGPADQSVLSDEIKQIRFLYHYVLSDGSLGPHNPEYITSILNKADELLTSIGR